MSRASGAWSAAAVLATVAVEVASGQEAANVPAPTQPPPGHFVLRGDVRYYQYDGGSLDVARTGPMLLETLRLSYGITKELSVEGTLPFFQTFFDSPEPGQPEFDPRATGIGDVDLTFKLRIIQEDLGPVDTFRLSLFGGTELPTSTNGFGSNSFDPQIGVTGMGIFGRHGFVQSFAWRFTTGEAEEPLLPGDTLADVFAFRSAYLFRIAPEEFTVEHRGAWYATLEAIGTAETNGDVEVLLIPGLLYEGPRIVLECNVGFPVVSDLRHRPEIALVASIGLRILF